ncbi:MAG: RnfABCDGE type electron transport complex subunit C [Bacilli bacterium]|nr:RnfABCDGE type electron transport complex subunit C [Bacilli bacterium]
MIAKTRQIDDIRKLTKSLPSIRYVDPEYVYLPIENARCTSGEVYVKEGDYVKVGTVVGKRFGGFFEQNIHSTVSGIVEGFVKKFHRTGKMATFIKIKNDKKDTFCETIHERTPEEIAKLTKEEITQIVKDVSLVGLGGSSFPTYIKFQTKDPIDTIIINGIECEPYLSSDHRLMMEFPDRIMRGIGYALQAFNAKRAIICIKHKYIDIYEVLDAVRQRYPHLPIEICRVGNFYPQGWEISMIKSALGIDIPSGVLPSKYGIMNFNVSTIVGLYKAIRYNMPVVKRHFTLTGDGIKFAQNFRVRIGTSIQELIEQCGGYSNPEKNKIFILGGPMMGASLVRDDSVVSKTVTSLIILNEEKLVEEPCVRCGSCVYSCPVNLQPVQIMNAYKAKDNNALVKLNTIKCIECGLCSYSCTSKIKVTDYVRKAKAQIKNIGVK